ncbi:MAG: cupin domain-containing protein [Novosphingobium sp.]|jgi:quercetin dioxygenase-like cupin family protein|nr:cupin domain-containing protein [Novosphingobium sp.]MBP6555173.1 cupin domain-containing protein [Novosphingobium sp.]
MNTFASRAGLIAAALCLIGSNTVSSNAPPKPKGALPGPLEAGWKGKPVCELLFENENIRSLRCTFAPGEGHERHFHRPHWGYIVSGSTMRITDPKGTAVRELKAGASWWSDGVEWHEAVNIGPTTGVYIITEPKS